MKKLVLFALLATMAFSLYAQTTKQDTIDYLYEKVQKLEHKLNYLDLEKDYNNFITDLAIYYLENKGYVMSYGDRKAHKEYIKAVTGKYNSLKNKTMACIRANNFTKEEIDVLDSCNSLLELRIERIESM